MIAAGKISLSAMRKGLVIVRREWAIMSREDWMIVHAVNYVIAGKTDDQGDLFNVSQLHYLTSDKISRGLLKNNNKYDAWEVEFRRVFLICNVGT